MESALISTAPELQTTRSETIRKPVIKTRILELDGLRGLAILLVLLWHFVAVPMQTAGPAMLKPIWTLLGVSWTGVDLFFVLSGFLIGGILLDNWESESYFKTFYIRRACRILPIYYLLIFAYFALRLGGVAHGRGELDWLLDKPLPFWSYATFTQNLLMAHGLSFGCGWLGITWSLAIEEQFYLLLPLLIRFVPRNRLPFFLIGGVLLAPILRGLLVYCHRPEALAAGYVMMPCRADGLLLGVIAAYALRRPEWKQSIFEHKRKFFLIFFALLLGVIYYAIYSPHFFSMPINLWGRSWFAVFYVFLLVTAVVFTEGKLAALMRQKWLMSLGTISYGVYLVHQIIFSVTLALVFPNSAHSPGRLIQASLVALALTLGLSAVLYRYIEKPIIAIGHRQTYR